ncbi:unnamed protein product, partial [Polarella glacialis]
DLEKVLPEMVTQPTEAGDPKRVYMLDLIAVLTFGAQQQDATLQRLREREKSSSETIKELLRRVTTLEATVARLEAFVRSAIP